MSSLVVCVGVPASGKTTWARQWVDEDPSKRIRINRDNIRTMMGPYWIPDREPLVRQSVFVIVLKALDEGYNVVADGTNFKQLGRYEKLISNQHEIKIADFTNVPIKTCITRDKKRDRSVGKDVIYDKLKEMEKYNIPQKIQKYEWVK